MNSIKHKNYLVFSIFAVVMGAAAGAVIWLLLKIMALGIDLVWSQLPSWLGLNTIVYTIAVCLLGGVLIGLWQKKYGNYPETLESVLEQLKSNGTYRYDNISVVAIAALLPLIFGGSIGPEAGLSGVIVGLCCWVGDKFKYSAGEVRELAKAGTAATLGIVFNSPFFGIANNLEDYDEEPDGTSKMANQDAAASGAGLAAAAVSSGAEHAAPVEAPIPKKIKMFIYIITVAGGFGIMLLLNSLFGGGLGISRFGAADVSFGRQELLAYLPLVIIGGLCGVFYMLCHKLTFLLAAPLADKQVIRGIIGGLALAVLVLIFPWTMFSGEHEMKEMMGCWQTLGLGVLLTSGIVKLLLINICINFGWRGGNIFPLIFAGTAIGFAVAAVFGINEVYAVGMVVAALCGYIMRKPVTVIAVLIICFPVNVLIPMAGAAYLGSLIPVFKQVETNRAEISNNA